MHLNSWLIIYMPRSNKQKSIFNPYKNSFVKMEYHGKIYINTLGNKKLNSRYHLTSLICYVKLPLSNYKNHKMMWVNMDNKPNHNLMEKEPSTIIKKSKRRMTMAQLLYKAVHKLMMQILKMFIWDQLFNKITPLNFRKINIFI
jgi:hypothetical protein